MGHWGRGTRSGLVRRRRDRPVARIRNAGRRDRPRLGASSPDVARRRRGAFMGTRRPECTRPSVEFRQHVPGGSPRRSDDSAAIGMDPCIYCQRRARMPAPTANRSSTPTNCPRAATTAGGPPHSRVDIRPNRLRSCRAMSRFGSTQLGLTFERTRQDVVATFLVISTQTSGGMSLLLWMVSTKKSGGTPPLLCGK